MRTFAIFAIIFLSPNAAHAVINTVALSGNQVTGLPGVLFEAFESASFNTTGQAAFKATFKQGSGGVTTANNSGVFKFAINQSTLIARQGAVAPSVGSATFGSFASMMIDDSGNIVVRGSLNGATANQGLWRYSSGGNSLIARTGSQGVPSVSSASFSNLPSTGWRLSGTGRLSFDGQLATAVNIVTFSNDRGLWSYQATTGSLISRESTHTAPSLTGETFMAYGSHTTNDHNQLAMIGTLNTSENVSTDNRNGIWRFTNGGGELLARTGMSNAPGLDGQSFIQFNEPAINNSGQVAFTAIHSSAAQSGMWLYSDSFGELVARAMNGGVPGVPGAHFADFQSPVLSDTGDLFFVGKLHPDVANSIQGEGIWQMNNTSNDRLVYRTGQSVPGMPHASFLDFTALAANEVGSMAFTATYENPGEAAGLNRNGLWIVNSQGHAILVAKDGDTLSGRTIDALSFVSGSGGSDGRATGFNSLNQLLFRATFTDGGSGLFLYNPSESSFAAADFNKDGYVDATDLQWWQNAFQTTADGDADGDGDTDGADFLIWQRQFTGPSTTLAMLSVPEPNVLLWGAVALVLAPLHIRTPSTQNF